MFSSLFSKTEEKDDLQFITSAITSRYSKTHLDKWVDVTSGKYYLCVGDKEMFFWNKRWYMGTIHPGKDRIYECIHDLKTAQQTILSMFFNPELTMFKFDYYEMVNIFKEKKCNLKIKHIGDYFEEYYLGPDDRLMLKGSDTMPMYLVSNFIFVWTGHSSGEMEWIE